MTKKVYIILRTKCRKTIVEKQALNLKIEFQIYKELCIKLRNDF